jgi:hypothetical protein
MAQDSHSKVDIDKVEGDIRDAVIAGRDVIEGNITYVFTGGADQQRSLRNRNTMLQKVKNDWVKGILEESLHGAVLIELGIEERKGAVEHP